MRSDCILGKHTLRHRARGWYEIEAVGGCRRGWRDPYPSGKSSISTGSLANIEIEIREKIVVSSCEIGGMPWRAHAQQVQPI